MLRGQALEPPPLPLGGIAVAARPLGAGPRSGDGSRERAFIELVESRLRLRELGPRAFDLRARDTGILHEQQRAGGDKLPLAHGDFDDRLVCGCGKFEAVAFERAGQAIAGRAPHPARPDAISAASAASASRVERVDVPTRVMVAPLAGRAGASPAYGR